MVDQIVKVFQSAASSHFRQMTTAIVSFAALCLYNAYRDLSDQKDDTGTPLTEGLCEARPCPCPDPCLLCLIAVLGRDHGLYRAVPSSLSYRDEILCVVALYLGRL